LIRKVTKDLNDVLSVSLAHSNILEWIVNPLIKERIEYVLVLKQLQ